MERAALRLAAKSEALAAPIESARKLEGLGADSAQDLGRRIWGLATDSEEGNFPAGAEEPASFSSLASGRPSQGHGERSGSWEESLQGIPLPAGRSLPIRPEAGAAEKAGKMKDGVPLIVMEVLGQSLFFSQRDVSSPASSRVEKKAFEPSAGFLGSSGSQPLMAQRGAWRSRAGFVNARLLLAGPMILSPLLLHWIDLPSFLGMGLAHLSAFGALVAADRDAYGWRRRRLEKFIPWLAAGTAALAHGFLWISGPPALGVYLGLGLLPALAFLAALFLMAQDSLTDLPKPWSGLLMLGVLAFALLGLAAALGTPAVLLWKAFLS